MVITTGCNVFYNDIHEILEDNKQDYKEWMKRRMGKVFDNRHRDIDDLQATVKEQQTLINEQQDCIDTLKACINHMEDTMMPHCQISQTHINKIKQQSLDIQILKDQINTLVQPPHTPSATPTHHHHSPSPVLNPQMQSTSNTPVQMDPVTSNPATIHQPLPLYPHTVQLQSSETATNQHKQYHSLYMWR
jgi:hypothetical protein